MQNIFIRKRRGKYYIVLDYRDPDSGKRKQKTLDVCEKSREADNILVDYKSKLNNGTFIKPEKLTVGEYLNQWIEKHKSNLSITTYDRYKDIITRHISPNLGEIELQKLTALHIENFYIAMQKKLSAKTVLQYHRLLHKAFDKAYKMQLIAKNPADLVEAPKPVKYKASILNVEQTKQLLNAAKNTRLEVPINLAAALGLREGEILGLSWENIDFTNNTICIRQALVRNKETKELELKEPKSDTSDRVITVPKQLMNILKEHKIKQNEKKLRSKGTFKNEKNLVFTQVNGEPMANSSFSRMFRDFLKRKKLPLVRFHDLRHTNASLMLKTGTELKVTSARLGHSSIGITADLYTHVLQELEVEAAEKVGNLLYK